MHDWIEPSDITPATAGRDWLDLKAAALSLKIGLEEDRNTTRRLIHLNILLLCVNVVAIGLWWQYIYLVVAYIFAASWMILTVAVIAETIGMFRRAMQNRRPKYWQKPTC
ncbi:MULTISPECIES: hypothetical protein [unclassified Bradyrhizobium]|uniref:hypothetical protein n=1 Tax=unclassified Bradyrhizobium TaxID=2631580 RepID=UPI0028EAAE61|nr:MULTISPECIES: hypothetical protein [unclassified Bradyrhizobium]